MCCLCILRLTSLLDLGLIYHMENVFVPAHLTDVEVVYQHRRGSKVPSIWGTGPLASANWRYVDGLGSRAICHKQIEEAIPWPVVLPQPAV
jgi:hypothetical protein